MGQNIVMVYLAQLKIEWFFSQNNKWKKYNKKEVKWKIAKAGEHYTEKKKKKKAAFFLTALRLHEKERKDVEEGKREGEVRQGTWSRLKQNRNNCYGKTKEIKREHKINRGEFKTLNIQQSRFSIKTLNGFGLLIIYKTGFFVVHLAMARLLPLPTTCFSLWSLSYSLQFYIIVKIQFLASILIKNLFF